MLLDLTHELKELVERCVAALTETEPTEIVYTYDELRANDLPNELALTRVIGTGANVYAIWTRHPDEKAWRLDYIGQRKQKACRERLKQHLFRKNGRTESKLERVKDALKCKRRIAVSAILVTPDEMRTAVEQALITRLELTSGWLQWNKHGRTNRVPVTHAKRAT